MIYTRHSVEPLVCVCSVAQSCPTLCDPMDCSPPGSSVHRIFQVRILKERKKKKRILKKLSFPTPGDLPAPRIKPASLALIDGLFTTAPCGNPTECVDDPTNKNDPLGSVTAHLRYLILPVGDIQ